MNISAQKERNNVLKKSNLIQFCSKKSAPNFAMTHNFAICSRDNIFHITITWSGTTTFSKTVVVEKGTS
jgi:hypothetical protein